MLLVPSCSSTAVREAEAYWHELTRFYARMLQCFVVFVNRVGTEGGLTFWGGSHVTGPDGLPLVHGPRSREAILYADLDLERVEKRRRELSIVGDPRLVRLGAGRMGLGSEDLAAALKRTPSGAIEEYAEWVPDGLPESVDSALRKVVRLTRLFMRKALYDG